MRQLILITILGISISSCVSLKPDSYGYEKRDYNQRTSVKNPHFKRKLNPIGVITYGAFGAIGFVIGSQADLIPSYDGEEQTNESLTGGIVGASVATATAVTIGNKISKVGEVQPLNSKYSISLWIKKSNPQYRLLGQSGSDVKLIHQSAENSFRMRSITDARDYHKVFGNRNKYYDTFLGRDYQNIQRQYLPELLRLFPQSKHTEKFKERYVKTSKNVQELVTAVRMYPQYRDYGEQRGVALMRNLSDLRSYHRTFPNSIYKETIVSNMISNLDRDDLLGLIKIYPNVDNINDAQMAYIDLSSSLREFLTATKKFPLLKLFMRRSRAAAFVYTLQEANTFKNLFGVNNKEVRTIFKRLLFTLARYQIPQLINSYLLALDPDLIDQGKITYLEKSSSIEEVYGVIRTYPELSFEIETEAFERSRSSLLQLAKYFKYYPLGLYRDDAEKISIRLHNELLERAEAAKTEMEWREIKLLANDGLPVPQNFTNDLEEIESFFHNEKRRRMKELRGKDQTENFKLVFMEIELPQEKLAEEYASKIKSMLLNMTYSQYNIISGIWQLFSATTAIEGVVQKDVKKVVLGSASVGVTHALSTNSLFEKIIDYETHGQTIVIIAEWYRKGTDATKWYNFWRRGSNFSTFEKTFRGDIKRKGWDLVKIQYKGVYTDDR